MGGKRLVALILIALWVPFFFLIYLVFNFALKLTPPPVKKEISLPKEHQEIRDLLWHYEISRKREKMGREPKKIEYNPFYTFPTERTPLQVASPRSPRTITLNMIISNNEKKVCIINQQVYKVGDMIDSLKVFNIGDYYVELQTPERGFVRLEVGATYSYF